MRKRLFRTLLILVLFFTFTSTISAAQGARVKETIFLPQDFYVGDVVELRVNFVPEAGMRVRSPSELPMSSWIDIHEVTLVEREEGRQARIRFSSYAPGTRTLPPIRLGDVVLDSIKIHTRSILDERSPDFVGIKNQLLVPGTRMTIAVLVALLFFGPILIFSFAGRVKHGFASLLAAQLGKRPYKRLEKTLRELKEEQEQMSSRKFYIVLEEEFRKYLSDRTGSDFKAITSSEFAEHFKEILPEGAEHDARAVHSLLRRSDMVKFGGENSDKQRRVDDMEIISRAAGEVERIQEERRKNEHRRRKMR